MYQLKLFEWKDAKHVSHPKDFGYITVIAVLTAHIQYYDNSVCAKTTILKFNSLRHIPKLPCGCFTRTILRKFKGTVNS